MKDLEKGERPAGSAAPTRADAASWRRIALGTPLGRGTAALDAGEEKRERSRRRCAVSLPASFTTIDPIRDRATGELYYDTSEREELLDVSLRGACMRVERAPENGTRVLLRIEPPGADAHVDLVARTRWSRIEYRPGELGARASAIVGLEVIGGSAEALDRYEASVQKLLDRAAGRLAAPEASG